MFFLKKNYGYVNRQFPPKANSGEEVVVVNRLYFKKG